jgi:hypothetical protein
MANKTLLLYGEGLNEQVFLNYLKGLYSYGNNIAVTVRRGKGGSARDIVADSARVPFDYDKRVTLLDNDKDETEMKEARVESENRHIELLESVPCLEALLLSILEPTKNRKNYSSGDCKKYFQNEYLNGNRTITDIDCKRLFPKLVLNQERSTILQLDRIIANLEGKI